MAFLADQTMPQEALVKLQSKGQMVIPQALRKVARVPEGCVMKVRVVKDGQFLVTAQAPIDKPAATAARGGRTEALREFGKLVAEIQQEAVEKGLDKMTMAEINAIVADVRGKRKKAAKPGRS